MPQTPKPNFRADRRLWHCQIGGVQHVLARLDDFRGDEAKAERHARREFARLLGEWEAQKRAGRTTAKKSPPLGSIAVQYFEDLVGRRGRKEVAPRIVQDYHKRVDAFVAMHGHRPADTITPAHVDDFLAGQSTWRSPNTRADFVRALGVIYRWARRRGKISCPPPEPSRPTGRKLKRDKVPSWAEVEAILNAIHHPDFHDFASFCAWTACRPSEAANLTAGDLGDGSATLTEHKTRKKTHVARVIILPRPARAIAERRAAAMKETGLPPSSPLFTTPTHRPWLKDRWGRYFDAARDRAGADERITLYTFRHARATQLLLGGATIAEVAALLGNSPEMVARTYSDVVNQMTHLRKVAEIGVEPEGQVGEASG